MFERFTERARQVVVLAQDEARVLGHDHIGTEHILLGLLREEEGIAARVLESRHVTLEEVRAQVARIVGEGEGQATGQIPFTPRAKKVLELSLEEAFSLGHNWIGTEHILLGLAREPDGVAARILLDFDTSLREVAEDVLTMLGGTQAHPTYGEAFSESPAITLEVGGIAHSADAYGRSDWRSAPIVIGSVVAAVGFPLGLLAGWLIWG